MISIYQCGGRNVGDTITKPVIEFLLKRPVKIVPPNFKKKLIGIGSTISWSAQTGDTLWGCGLIESKKYTLPDQCSVLALRGKLTQKILGVSCDIFGDPGIILPLVYNPVVEKKYSIGIVEHYIDRGLYIGEGHRIDIRQNWKSFVNELKSCESILSSSLHGLVLSEAYGIPCKKIKLSNNVIGGEFKFYDYLSAFNRHTFGESFDIEYYQRKLISIIQEHYIDI